MAHETTINKQRRAQKDATHKVLPANYGTDTPLPAALVETCYSTQKYI